MPIDPDNLSSRDRYYWMIASVVPRPIAFVSTVSANGVPNLAPFSYFNGVCSTPPIVSICIGWKRDGVAKDTWANIEQTGELVVNVVTEDYAEGMVATSKDWPPEVSEFGECGFTPVPSERVGPPRVAESPISLECTLHQAVPVGNVTLVLARVVLIHADDAVMTDGLPDPAKLRPMGRLGGNLYSPLGGILEISRG